MANIVIHNGLSPLDTTSAPYEREWLFPDSTTKSRSLFLKNGRKVYLIASDSPEPGTRLLAIGEPTTP